MSYSENNHIGMNNCQSAASAMTSDKYNKLVLTMAAVMGIIGSAAAGVSGNVDALTLTQMSTAAFPQLTAWLISYMMYQNPRAMQGLQQQKLLALPPASFVNTDNDSH